MNKSKNIISETIKLYNWSAHKFTVKGPDYKSIIWSFVAVT